MLSILGGTLSKGNAFYPQTEEIGLKIITTAKTFNKFLRESPYTSNTFSWDSPKTQTICQLSKRSPRDSKGLSGNPIDLEIQIFDKTDLLRE